MRTRALYGFSSQHPAFVGQTSGEQAGQLAALGCNAVFGGYEDHAFVSAAHVAGLAVYAEFGCFVGRQWWDRYPDSRPILADGSVIEPEGWYCGVTPTHLQVAAERLQAFEMFLRQYAVDGVWLDFIRWPCHWEVANPRLSDTSYDPLTLAAFSRDTGIVVPVGDPARAAELLTGSHRPAWIAWRCEQITKWVGEARALQRRIRPNALLGLFGVPWSLAERDGGIRSVVGQDYSALGNLVDVISPMTYHLMCDRPPSWIAEITAEIATYSTAQVWPIIQAVDDPGPLTGEEYGQAIDAVLNEKAASGLIVFTLAGALQSERIAVTVERMGGRRPQ